jgi:polysaccharide biosynthesis protein PslH
MKILIISPVLPYKNVGHGGGVVLYNLIKKMSQSHEIHLAAMFESFEKDKLAEISEFVSLDLATERKENSALSILDRLNQPNKKNFSFYVKKNYLRLHTLSKDLFNIPPTDVTCFLTSTLSLVQKNHYDIIQIEYIQLLHYITPKINHLTCVGVAHDVLTKTHRRIFLQSKNLIFKLVSLVRYLIIKNREKRFYKKLTRLYTLSEYDMDIISSMDKEIKVKVRIPGFSITDNSVPVKKNPFMILFVGYLTRSENIDAVNFMINEVLPKVWKKNAQAEFHIVGGGAPESLNRLHDGHRIFVHGYQSDLAAYYSCARVMVAPLFLGGGIIIKVIESLSHGLPTVATPIANEGVGATDREEILIARNSDDFAASIVEIIENDVLHSHIHRRSTDFFNQRFNIENITSKLIEDYESILNEVMHK